MSRHNWTPQDLPFQRDITVRVLHEAADQWADPSWREREPQARKHEADTRGLADILDTAPLTWLDADVCGLIAASMDTVPQWSPAACMAGETGLIAFEESPATLVWTGGVDGQWRTVSVDALAWQATGSSVTVRAMSRMNGAREHLSPIRAGIPFDDVLGMTMPLDGVAGAGADMVMRRREGEYDGPLAQGATVAALVGTVWLLMSQPTVVAEGPAAVAKVRRRTPSGGKQRVPVRVSTRTLTTAPSAGGRTGTGRKATTRWWVRGHWRQQAWGKNRALRKPIFIAPHTAGAADSDVDDRPQVQVWRTGEQ